MTRRIGGTSFSFRRQPEGWRMPKEESDFNLSHKLQIAYSEPANSGMRESLLSGERIVQLMGRKPMKRMH